MGNLLPRSTLTLIAFAIIAFTPAQNAHCPGKPRDWRTGKVVDSQIALDRVCVSFRIEGEMYDYVARQPLKRRWSKPARVRVNSRVKFVLQDRKLIVLDEKG